MEKRKGWEKLEKDTNRINRNRVLYRFYSGRIKRDINNFVKWIVLAIIAGVVVGGASSFFAGCIKLVTKTRGENPWIFLSKFKYSIKVT